MSENDPDDGEEIPVTIDTEEGTDARTRIGEGADRAVEEFDKGIVDLLAWVLDTETRARIYVYLRQYPGSTSEEIAGGTGLYPSTVREALAELNEEGNVSREKRESEGAGNNPYEYTAIAPSELVGGIVHQVQDELNTVFNLDQYLTEDGSEASRPITITVDDTDDEGEDDGDDAEEVEK
ncbi:winged helix-turn-helix domain-containing protein [Halalkalicoccus jeotgali]|uniref:Transcriptional regulator TrmB n=1 Tax=Halalkalicoccus jeotgali (strain DSM 18796 / CECT 7217 / JCM 14584 / KCTC 4019 / B3) TaxID=795797 RepID=D8J2I9_HALJB|nr:winged helix-turn-helix domain-containing protein [Halalkalicoccus jeotgali]ADJ14946.1 transcriptional regulator, TrmB [Halalkalicoccus jeotgali B3]ELY35038.1 transcriptional regulator TrmB [Halalkalicoccus jeotgali B3]